MQSQTTNVETMTKYNWIAIGTCSAAIIALWWCTPIIISCFGINNIEEKGQFGDQFGFYNALASSLTIILLIIATIYQHQQFLIQKREYEDLSKSEAKRAEQDLERLRLQMELVKAQERSNSISLLNLRFKNERDLLEYQEKNSMRLDTDDIKKTRENLNILTKLINEDFNDVFCPDVTAD